MTSSAKVDDRLRSDIEIIHAVGELDSGGAFADTNANGRFEIFVWVKNVGDTRVLSLDEIDVFVESSLVHVRQDSPPLPGEPERTLRYFLGSRQKLRSGLLMAPRFELRRAHDVARSMNMRRIWLD